MAFVEYKSQKRITAGLWEPLAVILGDYEKNYYFLTGASSRALTSSFQKGSAAGM